MSIRIIQCSRCNGIGHNSRNSNCPIKIQQYQQRLLELQKEKERERKIQEERTNNIVYNIQQQIWKRDYAKTYSQIQEKSNEETLSLDTSNFKNNPKLFVWLDTLIETQPPTTLFCPLCYEDKPIDKMVGISCEHDFCVACIHQWKLTCRTNNHDFNCPNCRRNIQFIIFDEMTPQKYSHSINGPRLISSKLTDHIYLLDGSIPTNALNKIIQRSVLSLLCHTL
jgi:hypothetical protein